jgi:hypothetical protein
MRLQIATIYRLVSLAALFFFMGTATAQVPLSRCRKFQELMRQKGLEVSVQLHQEFLFTGEILEPVIVVKNATQSLMEIPSIPNSTRVSMDAFEYRPSGGTPLVEACSIQTETLLPGGIKRFPLNYDLGVLFSRPDSEKDQYGSLSSKQKGRHGQNVRMGNFLMGFEYNSVFPKLEDTTCALPGTRV